MTESRPFPPGLSAFYEGWTRHQTLVIDALRDLTPEQVMFRDAPEQWAVWQLAAHVAGSRAYWFYDILGEGDTTVREMFGVERPTVPGVAIDDALWEDDEAHPRTADELVDGLERTWSVMDGCLRRWTAEDLQLRFERDGRTHHRGWVVWHVLEHDIHHGGEISQILGSHGLPGLDM